MIDIFRTSQPFPDDVEIRITLNRSPAAFAINATLDNDTAGYEITIHRADLSFTRLRIEGNVYDQVGDTIEYPFSSIETRHFTVPGGSNITQEVIASNLPKRMIASLMTQEAYIGKYDANPFYYGDHLLESVYLRKNQNISLPPDMYKTELLTKVTPATPAYPAVKDPTTQAVIKEAQPAMEAKTDHNITNFSRLYVESMRVLNDKSLNNVNIGITREDYQSGRFFMCWDFRVSPFP